MHFTSVNFLLFFPAVILLYYLTPGKYRWISLLVSSVFFYINIKPVYILLTLAISLSTYIFTRLIASSEQEERKRKYMIINIIIILLPLFFFKYFNTIDDSLRTFLAERNMSWPLPDIKFLLPVGISFYTFMAIGYTVDVFNEEVEAERNFGIVALFVTFFPLILSGPIERAGNMIPQFKKNKPLDYNDLAEGVKLLLWGYFMKLVVADRIGIYVDVIFNDLDFYNGTSILIATVLYPFQVYADLGGYSLIAIGVARILGLKVISNFNRPFFAKSMSEFWRRWHISLISWLTDYVYTPLSFYLRKHKVWGIVLALMLTFLISGIWHGAEIGFLVWGLMQGVFLSIEALLQNRNKRTVGKKKWSAILGVGGILLTFLMFMVSMVFARGMPIQDAGTVFRKIIFEQGSPYLDLTTLLFALLGIGIIMLKDFKDEYYPGKIGFFSNRNIAVRYSSYLAVIFMIILFGVRQGGGFIYFQF